MRELSGVASRRLRSLRSMRLPPASREQDCSIIEEMHLKRKAKLKVILTSKRAASDARSAARAARWLALCASSSLLAAASCPDSASSCGCNKKRRFHLVAGGKKEERQAGGGGPARARMRT